jgi:ferredoxin
MKRRGNVTHSLFKKWRNEGLYPPKADINRQKWRQSVSKKQPAEKENAQPVSDVQFMDNRSAAHSVGFCDRNLNLLAHAQSIELDIGSRCGGHGICGGDRVQFSRTSQHSALSAVTDIEKKHFTPEEIAQGWRLACQCFPENSNQLICLRTSSFTD